MAKYIFKGKKIDVPGVGIKWIPTANVRLISNNARYLCEMLVDTGADISLVPRSLGEFLRLNLDKEKIREIRGIGETAIPYVVKTIEFQIAKTIFSARIGIALIEEIPFILGRLDVFSVFNIEFKQKNQEIIFRTI
ncbi:aspartyl protease family protein [Candidatus Saganbacteria bacterium]|nr:aspartyl protease family protein [Candidatus Saganbacteria bacterium]